MKNLITTFLLLFLYGCGYSSIYENQNFSNLNINVGTMQGDKEFNNILKNELILYSNKNSKKNYFLTINSKYQKDVISKNSSGVATDYKLSLTSKISVKIKDEIKNFEFKEAINIKNNTDSFEQNRYEKNVKKNFASSIREQLIIKMLEVYDY